MEGGSEYAKTVAKNLRNVFFEHGVTGADVAKDLGLAKSTVYSWLTGQRVPKMPTVDRICKHLNCQIIDIIGTNNIALGTGTYTTDEIKIVEYFRSLPPEKQRALITFLGV